MWEIYHHKRASGVYFVRDTETKYVKIGYSLNIPRRIMELNQSAHYKDCNFVLERVILTSPTEARVLEKIMHEHYKKFNIEWELYDIKQYNDYYTNYKNITYRDKIILNHNYCMLNPINVIGDYDNGLNKILFKQTGLYPPTSIETMCEYLRKNSIFLYIPIDENELYVLLNCIREDDECEEIEEICYESIYDDYDTQLVNCKID